MRAKNKVALAVELSIYLGASQPQNLGVLGDWAHMLVCFPDHALYMQILECFKIIS